MKVRDKLYKEFILETNCIKKHEIQSKYKKYRNLIISLIRKNKKKHFSNYFTMYNSNIKKTWEGIRELVNINKKKHRNIQMINHNNHPITNNKEMSNVFNEFYSELGHNIEQQIPNSNTVYLLISARLKLSHVSI